LGFLVGGVVVGLAFWCGVVDIVRACVMVRVGVCERREVRSDWRSGGRVFRRVLLQLPDKVVLENVVMRFMLDVVSGCLE